MELTWYLSLFDPSDRQRVCRVSLLAHIHATQLEKLEHGYLG